MYEGKRLFILFFIVLGILFQIDVYLCFALKDVFSNIGGDVLLIIYSACTIFYGEFLGYKAILGIRDYSLVLLFIGLFFFHYF